jgi:hypothetical protein
LREKAKTQKPLSSIIERVLLKGARPFVAIKQHKEIDFHDVCAGPVLGSENRADRGDKLQAGDSTASFSFLAVWMHISVLLLGTVFGVTFWTQFRVGYYVCYKGANFGSIL